MLAQSEMAGRHAYTVRRTARLTRRLSLAVICRVETHTLKAIVPDEHMPTSILNIAETALYGKTKAKIASMSEWGRCDVKYLFFVHFKNFIYRHKVYPSL